MSKAAIVEQAIVPTSASLTELPRRIERRCCYGKLHGNTTLELTAVSTTDLLADTTVVSIAYRRTTNGDVYSDFEIDRLDNLGHLIGRLNDTDYWPLAEE